MGGEERPKRLTRAESQARTRNRLLDAARVVFARHGYQAATVEEIATEAGYTSGAVYSNFGSKEALFLALRVHMGGDSIADVAAYAPEGDDLQFTAVSHVLAALGDSSDEAILEAEFWLFAMRHPDHMADFQEQTKGLRDDLVKLTTAARERRGASWTTSDATATTVALAIYSGLTRQRRLNPEDVPPELFGKALNWLFKGLTAEGLEADRDSRRGD